MIYVIMDRGGLRDRRTNNWKTRTAALVVGAVIAGAAAGLLLGSVGLTVSSDARTSIVAALAALGVAIGVLEATATRRVPLVQRNRETRREWVFRRPVAGSFGTGFVIGAGFLTRVGFWIWYVVPLTCFAVASPVLGAVIFGCYSFIRVGTSSAFAVSATARRHRGDMFAGHRLQDWMVSRVMGVRGLCALVLLAVCATVLVNS
jgi:hypothetical protein